MKYYLISGLFLLPLVAQATPGVEKSLGGKRGNFTSTAHAFIDLDNGEEGASCSGTLISANHILTAGHCVTSPQGETIFVAADYTVTIGGNNYAVSAITANAGYNPNAEIGDGSSKFDIGVLTLATSVTNVSPLPIAINDPAFVGEISTFYGYGTNGKPSSKKNSGLKRSATGKIRVNRVADGVFGAVRKPARKYATSCPGDSGGAVVRGKGGFAAIIGTVSAGSTGTKNNGECKSTANPDDDTFVDVQSTASLNFLSAFSGISYVSGQLVRFKATVDSALKVAIAARRAPQERVRKVRAKRALKILNTLVEIADAKRQALLSASIDSLTQARKAKKAKNLVKQAIESVQELSALGLN